MTGIFAQGIIAQTKNFEIGIGIIAQGTITQELSPSSIGIITRGIIAQELSPRSVGIITQRIIDQEPLPRQNENYHPGNYRPGIIAQLSENYSPAVRS